MATGYVIFKSRTAFSTFDRSFSNANSGVCTPITTSPASLYFAAQPSTYGKARRQLMQEYVQKSITTTLPRNDLLLSAGELIQPTAPPRSGIGPSSGRTGAAALTGTSPALPAPNLPIKCSSAFAVFTKENLVSSVVSHPSAIATTPTITAAPSTRRIQTSKNSDRFKAVKTFFPASSAMPSEVAAPNA